MEILLLCGNGYGVAAQKILRGMYERVVTSRYLHLHPEETESFLAFHRIQDHKLMQAIKETFGEDALEEQTIAEVEARFQAVREQDRFLVTDCKKCGSKRLNYTWSKLDFVSMAREAGAVGRLIVPGYYIPMRAAHSTAGAMFDRLKKSEADGITFDGGPQHEEAKDALMTAHNLILDVLDLQKEHFGLKNMEGPLQKCTQDFLDIWRNPDA